MYIYIYNSYAFEKFESNRSVLLGPIFPLMISMCLNLRLTSASRLHRPKSAEPAARDHDRDVECLELIAQLDTS